MTTPAQTSPAPPKTVFVIGSGPIVIGQAAEFDYAGTQACRALREEGVRVVLVNSNPATIMTDEDIADVVYIEPLTVECCRADHRSASGRTACCRRSAGRPGSTSPSQLAEAGILEQVQCPAARHAAGGDQEGGGPRAFQGDAARARRAGPRSAICTRSKRRASSPSSVPPPLIIRPAYTLGGTGGGIARYVGRARREGARAACTPARSIRCWWSGRSWAGRRSSTR